MERRDWAGTWGQGCHSIPCQRHPLRGTAQRLSGRVGGGKAFSHVETKGSFRCVIWAGHLASLNLSFPHLPNGEGTPSPTAGSGMKTFWELCYMAPAWADGADVVRGDGRWGQGGRGGTGARDSAETHTDPQGQTPRAASRWRGASQPNLQSDRQESRMEGGSAPCGRLRGRGDSSGSRGQERVDPWQPEKPGEGPRFCRPGHRGAGRAGPGGGEGAVPEGVPGLHGHLGLLHAGQSVLGRLAGLLHVVLHEAQEGGVLGLRGSCGDSRAEWDGSASGEPLSCCPATHPRARSQSHLPRVLG